MTQTTCPYCGGTGKTVEKPCPDCNGTGISKKTEKKTVTVTIPVGVAPGEILSVSSCGEYPENGEGVRGNLNLHVYIDLPKGYSFMNNMGGVQYKMDVPFYDAMLGCEREVIFPNGSKRKIKIDKNTKNGRVYSHSGEGMKLKDGRARSSFDIIVNYTVPEKITRKQEEILKEFKNTTEND